ncbi:GNAT family N-acetyltransferase [Paenibacillus pedocola]|uniref:GNAT family N-acetyltransferase n=1 Tax=Paenibacillus pedocola TaxID=3242193 RepID=UPI002877FAD9|nr:GNAT family N-acetyltransferase [Paenibacillus typhae]
MPISFKPYTRVPGFTPEFQRVHEFLFRLNDPEVINEGFLWGRWEWMFSLPFLDTANLHKIGIWEDAGRIVGLATYEQNVGNVWFSVDPGYVFLKEEMLLYAKDSLRKDGEVQVLIRDSDSDFQQIAAGLGLKPTQEHECNAVIPIEESLMKYTLPEGYRIVSLADEFDLNKYNKVLWRGFNHEGEAPEAIQDLLDRQTELSGPHVDLNLKIAVAAPDGQFVAYCGMWHLPGNDYALVEPVATDPAYRMKGLGKAAVLEGVRRCGERGAKRAYVGSSQQFYYSIGFRPYSTETWWKHSSVRK